MLKCTGKEWRTRAGHFGNTLLRVLETYTHQYGNHNSVILELNITLSIIELR